MSTLPVPGLHGLYVDCGHYSAASGRWIREPRGEFTCRYGCALFAAGPDQVTRLCRAVWAWHAAHCPAGESTIPPTSW